MGNTTRGFALFGALLLTVLFAVALKAEGADVTAPTVTTPAADPAKQPWTIVALTRCDRYETLYITFRDGSFTTVDVSKSDPEAVNNYVLQAAKYAELKMDCTAVGHDSVR